MILGALNDGTWPALAAPDPWLNRAMRKAAGLLLPERQIGLSAHDYQQAVAAPRVVLSRAIRSVKRKTVPSRWLNRLTNLMEGLPESTDPKPCGPCGKRRPLAGFGGGFDTPEGKPNRPSAPRPARRLRPARRSCR